MEDIALNNTTPADSRANNNEPTASTIPEIVALQPSPTLEDQREIGNKVKFDAFPTGLIALTKSAYDAILTERETLEARLIEANKIIDDLRKEANPIRINNHQEIVEQYRTIVRLQDEQRGLEKQLSASNDELSKLKVDYDSYEIDYEDLLEDYNYLEEKYFRLKKLFKERIQEVYRAHVELREAKLRPKAPDGCLNCGKTGHSYRSCQAKYSGKFCQICAHPDFSTKECPWPHYSEWPHQLPERLRCKCCWRPLNLPDVNCHTCRKRMIESALINRNKLALELEVQHTLRTSAQNQNPVIPEADRPQDQDSPACSPPTTGAPHVEVDVIRKLSPYDSDAMNAILWESLAQVHKLNIEKDEEQD